MQAIVLENLESVGAYKDCLHLALNHMASKFAEARKEGTWRSLQSHALKLLSLCEGYPFPTETFDQLCTMFYLILYDMCFVSQRDESIRLAQNLSERLIEIYGLCDMRTMQFLRFMGRFYYNTPDLLASENVLKQALENERDRDSDTNEDTMREIGRTYRMLSVLYVRDGQPLAVVSQAKVVAKKAFDIEQGLRNPSLLDLALYRQAIGHACRELGEYAEAQAHFQQSLLDLESCIGLHNTIGIKTLHDVGGHRRLVGKLDSAQEALQEGLDHVGNVFGLLHIVKPKLLDSLGEVYFDHGEFEKSLDCYNEALTLKRKIHADPIHNEAGKSLFNLSVVYRTMGQYTLALEHLNQALEARRHEYGIEHPRTVSRPLHLKKHSTILRSYESCVLLSMLLTSYIPGRSTHACGINIPGLG